VFRFIDLCVEERKGRYAKEALMQYRNTCQNVNINSLEEVIKYLLKKATERAEDAQAKADVRPRLLQPDLPSYVLSHNHWLH
jgi:translation initiation factor 3 subunit A